jgi:hypothetical protein
LQIIRGVLVTTRSTETKIFLLAHLFLLAVVLIGFGRTFYLRSLFIARPLPLALLLHGIALTMWYGMVVLQGWLVLKGHRRWHARIAWLAIPIVVGVVISGIQVNMNVALQIESASSPENMFVWGNFMSLLSFVILVIAGVKLRHRFQAHHRLIFFASLAIIGPAFARFAFWPVIGLGLSFAPIFAIAGMLLLVVVAVSYDVTRFKRVQAATLAGLGGVIIPLILGTAVALSGIGYSLLQR